VDVFERIKQIRSVKSKFEIHLLRAAARIQDAEIFLPPP
jgi:Xaa-Pro aminopeptidase